MTPAELTPANRLKAYAAVLDALGMGATAQGCAALMPMKVLHSVPSKMHSDLPHRLLAAATAVCCAPPYSWGIKRIEPTIDQGTTFQSLFDEWFVSLI